MSKHEQQAKYWLNDASAEYRNGNAKRAGLCVGMAQVEATLALAEQQRIANLIALTRYAVEQYENYAPIGANLPALFTPPETVQGNMTLNPEIAQALGIGNE